MTDFWWGFLAGCFVGAWIGFFALALCIGARESGGGYASGGYVPTISKDEIPVVLKKGERVR